MVKVAKDANYIQKVPEAVVLRGCLQFLTIQGIFHWRQNTGSTKIDDRYVKFGEKGIADIIGILPDGVFFAVECKASTGGTQSIDQKKFQQKVDLSNGVYLLVNDLQRLVDFVNNYLKKINKAS